MGLTIETFPSRKYSRSVKYKPSILALYRNNPTTQIVMSARPSILLFEAANPRHAHEVDVFKQLKHLIPDDKILVPGVIDSTSNYIEHPRLVAKRLLEFSNIVGKER